MPLEYEEYAGKIPAEKLEQELDAMNDGVETHLTAIAKELMDWEDVAPQLKLKHGDVKDIIDKFPNDPAKRRPELLRVWKRKTGKATYAKLLRACVDTNNKESAEMIVEVLNASSDPSKVPSTSKEKPPKSDDPPAAISNEQPKFDKDEQNTLFKERKPGHPPKRSSPEHDELCKFRDEVMIILQTVNENEYQAAVTFLDPPSKTFEKSIVFPSAGTVLGCFGNHRVALIQTDVGANIVDYIQSAIDTFKKAKFIIGVGVGYAFDRKKYKFGDVLVSKKISDLRNWKFTKGGEVTDRGERIDAVDDLQKLFCRNLNFDKDFEVAKPELPSKKGRISKAYSGTFASFAVLMDNLEMREKFGAAVPEVIGGEMEGGELMRFQKRKKIDGVIIIKGVVDYGDGLKEKGWQFTAAMAALTYTRDKLRDLQAD